jgi:hypothetical protein
MIMMMTIRTRRVRGRSMGNRSIIEEIFSFLHLDS